MRIATWNLERGGRTRAARDTQEEVLRTLPADTRTSEVKAFIVASSRGTLYRQRMADDSRKLFAEIAKLDPKKFTPDEASYWEDVRKTTTFDSVPEMFRRWNELAGTTRK